MAQVSMKKFHGGSRVVTRRRILAIGGAGAAAGVLAACGGNGQKRISELGRGMPARVSLAKSAAFSRPDTTQKEEYFQEAMEYSGYQPVTKYWDEMWKIVSKHYGDMANPALQKKPDTFLSLLTKDINTLLSTGALPTGY